jgi:hypothetical protein
MNAMSACGTADHNNTKEAFMCDECAIFLCVQAV